MIQLSEFNDKIARGALCIDGYTKGTHSTPVVSEGIPYERGDKQQVLPRVLTRVTDKSEINFEQAYVEVRDLLETHPWSDFKLRLSDNYLGPDVKDLHHRSEPVWPPLKEEEIRVDPRSPPPLYSRRCISDLKHQLKWNLKSM